MKINIALSGKLTLNKVTITMSYKVLIVPHNICIEPDLNKFRQYRILTKESG